MFQYEMLPTTWFYISAIIILAIFFKFNRIWSVRNFDLICVILLTPGLLLIAGSKEMGAVHTGYAWLFCIQGLLVIRLILDTIMVRRPLLEPNLSREGLSFAVFFLLFFLIAALVVNRGEHVDNVNTVRLEQILTARHIHEGIGMRPDTFTIPQDEWDNMFPGFRPFIVLTERANLAFAPPGYIQQEIIQRTTVPLPDTTTDHDSTTDPDSTTDEVLSLPQAERASEEPANAEPANAEPTQNEPGSEDRASGINGDLESLQAESVSLNPELKTWLLILTFIIAGHLLIVCQLVYIGHRHFGQLQTGIACAALYLFHPYAAQMIGRLDHIIPAALILWSVLAYRRPFFAGLGIGTAAALVWYPIWLVPLWCSFYWQKGWMRFLAGTTAALLAFALFLLMSPLEWGLFYDQLMHMAGKTAFLLFNQQPVGFWTLEGMYYRMPILALFIAMCFSTLFVPSHKHLASLIGWSALVMLSVQFVQIYQGGLYLAWYLPLLILTIFRPNLEDKTARSAVVGNRF